MKEDIKWMAYYFLLGMITMFFLIAIGFAVKNTF